jgi:hypothetical protein
MLRIPAELTHSSRYTTVGKHRGCSFTAFDGQSTDTCHGWTIFLCVIFVHHVVSGSTRSTSACSRALNCCLPCQDSFFCLLWFSSSTPGWKKNACSRWHASACIVDAFKYYLNTGLSSILPQLMRQCFRESARF